MKTRANFLRKGNVFHRAARLFELTALLTILALAPTAEAADYWVTTDAPTGPNSLSRAIHRANITSGRDRIFFDIPGPPTPAGYFIIRPTTTDPIEVIRDEVLIDAYTQPGASPNTNPWSTGVSDLGTNAVIKVVIDGRLAGAGSVGLNIQARDSRVRGLSVVNFEDPGAVGIMISSEGAGRDTIDGNFIGVLPDGVTTRGNETGVLVDGVTYNLIGGREPENRNLIATGPPESPRSGVHLREASYNDVEGNLFGTEADGLGPLASPMGGAAIWIEQSTQNTIGGALFDQRNVIGHHHYGALVTGGSFHEFHGNFIGTDLHGEIHGSMTTLGNGDGIRLMGTSNNLIWGGQRPNVIAYNEKGIVVVEGDNGVVAVGNRITSNSINENDLLGIDLVDDDVTRNDAGDVDLDANFQQNFPRLLKATRYILSTDVRVSGYLRSHPITDYVIEFFAVPECDPVFGFGEGERFLGQLTKRTNPSGVFGFSIDLLGVEIGECVTATATDPDGNTSEFSGCREVLPGIIVSNGGVIDLVHLHGLQASFRVPLINETPTAAYDLTASLQSEDEGLTVVMGSTPYDPLPGYGRSVGQVPFLLEIQDMGNGGTYLASLMIQYQVDGMEYEETMPIMLDLGSLSGVGDRPRTLGADLRLQAAPNPANPFSTISFELPAATRVSLRMYDAAGRLVRELADADMPAGPHAFRWDGCDSRGLVAATGVYYYRLTAGREEAVGKLVILK